MPFVPRTRTAFVFLNPGESKRFRLPLTTNGVIQISAHDTVAPPGGWQDSDNTQNWTPVRETGFVPTSRSGTTVGTIERSTSAEPHNPANELDPDPNDPSPGPTLDLVLKLEAGPQVSATDDRGSLIFENNGNADNWTLELTRKPGGVNELRKYRIKVTYPSVLPLEERRVPLSFLRRGLEENWNDHRYLEDVAIIDNHVKYRWNRELALLYHLSTEVEELFFIGDSITDPEFPVIRQKSMRIEVGVDPDPPKPRVYFALKVELFCDGSRTIDIPGPDNIDLPQEPFWVHLRFYLELDRGQFCYSPRILTSLDPEYVAVLDIFDLELTDIIKRAETALHEKQWDEHQKALFDKHLRPWMLGHYEALDIQYDPGTDEIVIVHVGKPVERPPECSAHPTVTGPTLGLRRPPRLFDTADEVWAVPAGPASNTGPFPQNTTPGALGKIDHIVVLMQENRSFDQVLGYLSRDKGLTDVEGLLPGVNERDVNEYDRLEWRAEGTKFPSQPAADTAWPDGLNGPCHGHHCVVRQMADGMKHFVDDFGERNPQAPREHVQRIMDYYTDSHLPAYAALVREFAICDHWFSSHIGGTWPNRHITVSGELNRDPQDVPEEENADLPTYCPSERLTFFDHLTSRGVSWKLYEHGYSFLRLYRKYTFDTTNIVAFSEFKRDCENGTLPSVAFIEPDYIEAPGGNDDHAPADMLDGQKLVASVVSSLINAGPRPTISERSSVPGSENTSHNRSLWDSALLVITYDEHGGFYDHVVPPDRIDVKQPDGTTVTREIPPLANNIRQLGPRVPAFVVSPLIPASPNGVNVHKQVFEHASIPATILRRFCSPRPPDMGARVKMANDLRDLLTLDTPRPKSDFARLLAQLEDVAATPIALRTTTHTVPVPIRKMLPGSPGAEEDFHGFIAFASAMTGVGPR